ncbi:unnamed protein product [Fusarium fujikuroi]|nr:unnamed protein product [Fusarium fujikuroi]
MFEEGQILRNLRTTVHNDQFTDVVSGALGQDRQKDDENPSRRFLIDLDQAIKESREAAPGGKWKRNIGS